MPSKKNHPVFTAPEDLKIPIWRYMDFTKYVALLESRALFFARADLLGDPFEGSISKANMALRPEIYKEAAIPQKIWDQLSSFNERIRYWTFVNCWHMNQHESAAMWRLYSATNQAIAVKSTYEALCDVLPETALVGVVKYIDYATEWLPEGNTMWPYVHKRQSFQHEQELRAVIQEAPTRDGKLDLSNPPTGTGELVPVALESLLREVIVAPTAPGWFRDLTKAITIRYGINTMVNQSQLDEAPVF